MRSAIDCRSGPDDAGIEWRPADGAGSVPDADVADEDEVADDWVADGEEPARDDEPELAADDGPDAPAAGVVGKPAADEADEPALDDDEVVGAPTRGAAVCAEPEAVSPTDEPEPDGVGRCGTELAAAEAARGAPVTDDLAAEDAAAEDAAAEDAIAADATAAAAEAESAATAATAAGVGATDRRTRAVGSASVPLGRSIGRASVRRMALASGRCAGAGSGPPPGSDTGEPAKSVIVGPDTPAGADGPAEVASVPASAAAAGGRPAQGALGEALDGVFDAVFDAVLADGLDRLLTEALEAVLAEALADTAPGTLVGSAEAGVLADRTADDDPEASVGTAPVPGGRPPAVGGAEAGEPPAGDTAGADGTGGDGTGGDGTGACGADAEGPECDGTLTLVGEAAGARAGAAGSSGRAGVPTPEAGRATDGTTVVVAPRDPPRAEPPAGGTAAGGAAADRATAGGGAARRASADAEASARRRRSRPEGAGLVVAADPRVLDGSVAAKGVRSPVTADDARPDPPSFPGRAGGSAVRAGDRMTRPSELVVIRPALFTSAETRTGIVCGARREVVVPGR